MPKKMYQREPAWFFEQLLDEVHATAQPDESKFTVKTDDPVYASFAAELIEQHYPPQTELPLN